MARQLVIQNEQLPFWHLHVAEFMEPENCPPNIPNLNPVDYSIRRALQQLVYHRRGIRDVEHLKEVLQTC